MDESYSGQWFEETATGDTPRVIVDLDEDRDELVGTGRVFFADGSPGAICDLKLPRKFVKFEAEVQLFWIPPGAPIYLTTEKVREHFPDHQFSNTAKIELQTQGTNLLLSWKTDIGTSGVAQLTRSDMKAKSQIPAKAMSWDQFKEFALQKTAGTLIFRGQPKAYKLRTAFHRSYRKDLVKYSVKDIPVAHRQLTALTRHIFDLEKAQERGAFWNLLQHHGFPTPLLDWTYSPFVAAFFAFRHRKADEDSDRRVRILAFEKQDWLASFNQLDAVNFVRPHFSLLEALAIENPRAIPQQAVSTLTNIDDIEKYIAGCEAAQSAKYLHAIDLDADARPHVMAELSMMGITAGSLFPGIDGACEELMGRFFHHQVPPKSYI